MTHDEREPTLRELTALFKGFEKLMNERDTNYKYRFESQEKNVTVAMSAAKEATASAFAASEKAIEKAEVAQREYNTRSNEFRAALDDANKRMITRPEAESLIGTLRELSDRNRDEFTKAVDAARNEARQFYERNHAEIRVLSEARSTQTGQQQQRVETRENNQWVIGICITVGLAVAALIIRWPH